MKFYFRGTTIYLAEMNTNHSISLMPGEREVYEPRWIWATSAKSLPSYRISVSVPLMQEVRLIVTNRRIVLRSTLFHFIRVNWMAWFRSEDNRGKDDILKTVAIGHHSIGGSYLELITEAPVHHWLRGREARIRLFMKDAESVRNLLQNR